MDFYPPREVDRNYRRWNLPAQAWPGAEMHEEQIILIRLDGGWHARTEIDQCVHRDLDADEIASVRSTFGRPA